MENCRRVSKPNGLIDPSSSEPNLTFGCRRQSFDVFHFGSETVDVLREYFDHGNSPAMNFVLVYESVRRKLCSLRIEAPSFVVNRNMKASGNRDALRLTASFKRLVWTP
jgi:hypothetical protein